MKTITMILMAGFLILPITSQAAKGGKHPSESCVTDWSACSVTNVSKETGLDHTLSGDPDADPVLVVREAIENAVYEGRNKVSSETNLIVKLDSAEAKLTCGKVGDAVDKLVEISTKAYELETAPKPKLVSSSDIDKAVSAAITCLVPQIR